MGIFGSKQQLYNDNLVGSSELFYNKQLTVKLCGIHNENNICTLIPSVLSLLACPMINELVISIVESFPRKNYKTLIKDFYSRFYMLDKILLDATKELNIFYFLCLLYYVLFIQITNTKDRCIKNPKIFYYFLYLLYDIESNIFRDNINFNTEELFRSYMSLSYSKYQQSFNNVIMARNSYVILSLINALSYVDSNVDYFYNVFKYVDIIKFQYLKTGMKVLKDYPIILVQNLSFDKFRFPQKIKCKNQNSYVNYILVCLILNDKDGSSVIFSCDKYYRVSNKINDYNGVNYYFEYINIANFNELVTLAIYHPYN